MENRDRRLLSDSGGFPFDRIPHPGAGRVKTAMIGATFIMLVLIAALACRIYIKDRAYKQWAEEYNQNLRMARLTETRDSDGDSARENNQNLTPDMSDTDRFINLHGFYEKLSNGADIKILIIGNDTGAGMGASSPDSAWTEIFSRMLLQNYGSDIDILNISMHGNSPYAGLIRSAAALSGDVNGDNLNNLNLSSEDINAPDNLNYSGYDLAVLCYAPDENMDLFPACYEALIRLFRRQAPECDLLILLDTVGRENNNNNNNLKILREIADVYGIPIADIWELLSGDDYIGYQNLTLQDSDFYLNDWGHAIYARILRDLIQKTLENHNLDYKNIISPVTPGASEFENIIYYGADAFTRDGSGFVLELDAPVSGRVGFYAVRVPGLNGWQVYGDENLMAGREFYWEGEPGEHISLLENDQIVTAENKISVLFYDNDFSPAAGDNFLGVCFTRGPDL